MDKFQDTCDRLKSFADKWLARLKVIDEEQKLLVENYIIILQCAI